MNNTYDKITRFCLFRERCTYEVLQKLRKLEVDENDWQEVIRQLKEEKYLDDVRYIKAYINAKIYIKKWGKKKIQAELSMRRLDKEVVKQNFLDVDDDVYIGNLNHLAERKWPSLSKKSDREKTASLYRYLASKGYESDLIMDWVKMQAKKQVE